MFIRNTKACEESKSLTTAPPEMSISRFFSVVTYKVCSQHVCVFQCWGFY